MIASIMSPYGIFVFGSSYLVLSACLTSAWQVLAMTVTQLVSTYLYPSWMPDQDFDHVFWYTLVLIPLVILSNLWFWLIQKIVHSKNAIYEPILAIKNDDEEYFEALMDSKQHDYNLPIPGDKWMRSTLLIGTQYSWLTLKFIFSLINVLNEIIYLTACDEQPKFAKLLVEQGHLLKINLNQQDILGRTPLIIACQNKSHRLVRALLMKDINLDLHTFEDQNSAIHWACLSADHKIVQWVFKYALQNQVPLVSNNAQDETGVRILLSNHETSEWACDYVYYMVRSLYE